LAVEKGGSTTHAANSKRADAECKELRQVIHQVHKERDELKEKLQKNEDAMLDMARKMKEGSSCWFSRCFVLVAVLGLFVARFKK
jgi:predicted nuclease with TOPRIM domain